MFSIEGKSFASIARGLEIITLKKEDIQAFFRVITEENGESRIVSLNEIISKTKERTIIFNFNKKLEQLKESNIKTCLGPVIKQIKYLARGTRFVTIKARFES